MDCFPLNAEEKKWLKSLERVFAKCPSDRIGCYTTGDAHLNFYDKDHLDVWRFCNPDHSLSGVDASIEHDRSGSTLGSIATTVIIDSCQ